MNKITIRMATIDDAEAILKIYEPYILNTAITFEYDTIPLPTFKERILKVMEQFPWLVCTVDGIIAGYAYCSPHFERAAFAWDCECSVYIDDRFHRRGIANALYEAMFNIIIEQGYYNIYSLICVPNTSSVTLHEKFGFIEIGTFNNTGYKLGQWRNLLTMEKRLRSFEGEPNLIVPINQISEIKLEEEFRKAESLVKV